MHTKKIILIVASAATFFFIKQYAQQPQDAWTNLHHAYRQEDWIDKPSLFSQQAIAYFPHVGTILDLGAGQGQDSRFFAEHGYIVVSTDISDVALALNKNNIPTPLKDTIFVQKLDIAAPFDFPDNTFDVVYAHLSLHYFNNPTTTQIFNEIYRVLKPNGILAVLLNADTDPECGTGQQIQEGFFQIGQATKRYFNTLSIKPFVYNFETLILDNVGESYKDNAKSNKQLIRFIGKKINTSQRKIMTDLTRYAAIEPQYPSYVDHNHYGLCLRAAQDLPKVTIVATASLEKTDKPYIAEHPSEDHRHVALMHVAQDGTPTWGRVRGKWAFCNHSCDPNCDLSDTWQIITNRGIKKGQELTTSYDAYVPNFPWPETWNFTCLCASPLCKGVIKEYRMDILDPTAHQK